MKKTILNVTLMALVSMLASCNAQGIKGSGNQITDKRAVSPFHQIETDGVFNVVLVQADNEGVTVLADDNIAPLIVVESTDGVLRLSTKKHSIFKRMNKVLITVMAKSIDKLVCDGVGNVSTEGIFKTDKLDVVNDGVGNLTLNLVCSQLKVKATGVGNVTLTGTALDANIKNDGVGNLHAENLAVETLHVDNSGVGNTDATASKEAYLDDSGVGNVRFKGNAAIKHLDKSGVGKISVN